MLIQCLSTETSEAIQVHNVHTKTFMFIFGLVIPIAFSSQTNATQPAAFTQCLNHLSDLAADNTISDTSISLISNLKYQSRVIELDRNQPEFLQTFPTYFNKRVNDWRIQKGREKLAEHKDFLASLTDQHGIPGHYLVAFWGLETMRDRFSASRSTCT